MTRTATTNLPAAARPRPMIPAAAWVWIAVCTALFGLMHWEFLYRTWLFSKDPNWSHVLIIPLISVYYIHQHRRRLDEAPKRLCWWALPLVFLGLYAYVWGIFPGRNDMMRGYSMVFTVFATVLFLLGPSAMRVLWFPVAYLVFAVKISDAIWERVAAQLQDVAAAGATVALKILAEFMNFTVTTSGNTITMGFMNRQGVWEDYPMNVAEACSGLRMLMAFIALGVALAFLFDRTWWQRLIMVALAVPIAVLVNIGRVTALGVISTIDKEYATGDFHLFVGMMMLVPAALLFLGVGWVLDHVIIRGDAEDESAASPAPGTPTLAAPAGPAATGATITRAALLGGGLALGTGAVYAMLFNGLSARPLFPAVPAAASWAVAAGGVGVLVGLTVLAVRSAPGRRGPAALAFGAALTCGVFGVAAAGKHSVLSWQQVVLHKEAVDLRHRLTRLPAEIGPYVLEREDVLPPEIVDELGTENYLSRWYRDTRVPEGEPGHLVRLHAAYYTGLSDTVPHVPDRCFVAGGVQHKGLASHVVRLDPSRFTEDPDGPGFVGTATLPPPGEPKWADGTVIRLPSRDIDATRFTYGSPGRGDADQHVTYFFVANGKFLDSPNRVRLQGFDIRDRYSYYCKVEVQILGVADRAEFDRRVADLLDAVMPDIMACLPDWADVQAGVWPPDTNPAR
ncbi:MAG: exosortase/archaeosortase family protein [Planctomycetota bacterium]